jgi:hypothetical protein
VEQVDPQLEPLEQPDRKVGDLIEARGVAGPEIGGRDDASVLRAALAMMLDQLVEPGQQRGGLVAFAERVRFEGHQPIESFAHACTCS